MAQPLLKQCAIMNECDALSQALPVSEKVV
jgi:hypothetical protein